MRGQTLANVRNLLKSIIGDELVANTAADARYNFLLENFQEDLCSGYDWPFLFRHWDQTAYGGSQFLDLPTNNTRGEDSAINFDRPVWVHVKHNSRWIRLETIIRERHLNQHDSDLAEMQDPVQRWELVSNEGDATNPNQFEVWPRPVTAQKIRFTGQKQPRAFSSDSHKAELDDRLLAYGVGAQILALREQASAPRVQRMYEELLVKLRAGSAVDSSLIILGANLYNKDYRKNVAVKIIGVASGEGIIGEETLIVGNP